MTGNQPADRPAHNLPEYTVGEISNALRRTVEDTYSLVRVRGEISGFKRHSSGHFYYCLKDAEAVLDAVSWRSAAARLGVVPEDGLEVVCTGRLTTFPGRSKYQMVVERMELAGQGALLKLLEDRRRRLAEEGLFDAARKKPIPFLPEVIGVVTSPTGAVIRDILHRLADRFPRRVLLWPVAVQGEGAAEQVAAAIRGFNAIAPGGPVPRPDVLIVARGGGSLEDLWAFNEEVVVRAAAASAIPLISAVGHETDTTLIDHAADLRAPTPTGAAEKAVPVRADLVAQVAAFSGRLTAAMHRGLAERRMRVEGLGRGLPRPRQVIEDGWRRLDDRTERLKGGIANLLHRREVELERCATRLDHAARTMKAAQLARCERQALQIEELGRRLAATGPRIVGERLARIDRLDGLLESYSYENVLARGYAVVRGADGHVVESGTGARLGDEWTVRFKDGDVPVLVRSGAAPRKRRKTGHDERQETLF